MKKFLSVLPFILILSAQTVQASYEIKATLTVANPPAAGSQEEAADFETLSDIQNTRTAEDCRIAQGQSAVNLRTLFGGSDGILNNVQLKILSTFMNEVDETADDAAAFYKEKFGRLRPYDKYSSIQPCISKPNKPGVARSYPSGHATIGMLMGLVLADLMPAQAIALKNHGIQVGTNRIIGGVHYPSDVVAGQDLARQLYKALQQNPSYRSDFANVKKRLP